LNPEIIPAFERALEPHFGPLHISKITQLAGGASKEAWAVDLETKSGTLEVLVRRAGGGTINSETLTLEQEFAVLRRAFQSGVTAPEPLAYLPDCLGREAFVMRRLQGEGVGRRIVTRPEFAAARAVLPIRMAEELARIHAVSLEGLEFLPGTRVGDSVPAWIERLRQELDSTGEAHPVIELALHWLEHHAPNPNAITLQHGDFRIGNLLVSSTDLIGVLDWEFAHTGDPAEDIGWALIRAWRFGQDQLRLGGIGTVEDFLEHYNALSGRNITLEHLFFWEVMGNVKWAVGALTQARRHLNNLERNVELATLGRLACEMEFELLSLLGANLEPDLEPDLRPDFELDVEPDHGSNLDRRH
jgi:aminoglycoside phosphotransferase (APT) family kinase protein